MSWFSENIWKTYAEWNKGVELKVPSWNIENDENFYIWGNVLKYRWIVDEVRVYNRVLSKI